MKAFAHLAPTVPAIFVAAIGMSLTVYLLHGARVQSEPAPLLAVIGGAAGRVAADLPATVEKHAAEPVGRAASYAQQATTPSVQFVPRRRTAATTAHSIHRSARSGVVRRGSSVPRQATAFAAAATPVTARAHGQGHGRALKSTAGALVPRADGHGKAHGHGKAFGRSSEHHHGLARGHAKKAPTAPLSAPATPPKMNGGGHGHKGGKK